MEDANRNRLLCVSIHSLIDRGERRASPDASEFILVEVPCFEQGMFVIGEVARFPSAGNPQNSKSDCKNTGNDDYDRGYENLLSLSRTTNVQSGLNRLAG